MGNCPKSNNQNTNNTSHLHKSLPHYVGEGDRLRWRRAAMGNGSSKTNRTHAKPHTKQPSPQCEKVRPLAVEEGCGEEWLKQNNLNTRQTSHKTAFPTMLGRGTACGGGGLRQGMAQAEQPEHPLSLTPHGPCGMSTKEMLRNRTSSEPVSRL